GSTSGPISGPAGGIATGSGAGGLAGGAPGGGQSVHSPMIRLAPSAPARGAALAPSAQAALDPAGEISLLTFGQVVDLIRAKRDMVLLTEVENDLRLVRYAPGRIEFEPAPKAASDLAARLSQRLQGWTGQRWGVSVVTSGGAPTIAEMRASEDTTARSEALDNPLVQAVLAAFPAAKITAVRQPDAPSDASDHMGEDTLGGDASGEDWDPFEDD
ncbi:MAG: DNA polymerase III subunit gamma/tau, partial [Cypionkella sp.]